MIRPHVAFAQGQDGELGAVFRSHLAQDRTDVLAGGGVGDSEFVRDFLVTEARYDSLQDRLFPVGQPRAQAWC